MATTRRAVRVRKHVRRVKGGGHTTVKTHTRTVPAKLQKAYAFFLEHAGGSKMPNETWEEGKARGALALAKAEAYGARRGWTVEWQEDPEPYMMGDEETEHPSEVLGAVLKDERGNVLDSLWGIGDPSRSYARVVEAELMMEAMP